jgi:hypothetical protein
MSNNLSITLNDRVFQCPNCKETINTSAQRCPFCTHVIDPGSAQAAADDMARVSQACNAASDLKMMAGLIPVLFGLAFVARSFRLLAVLNIFTTLGAAIRWRLRFGAIQTDDPDFRRARRTAMIVLWACGTLAAIAVVINLRVLFAML